MRASAGSSKGGSWGLWLLLALAVVVTVLVVPSSSTAAYDLDSAAPDGYRALRLLLEENHSSVEAIDAGDVNAAASSRFATVYLPTPLGATAAQLAKWRDYADNGGTLVLGERPGSAHRPPALSMDQSEVARVSPGDCPLAVLGQAGPILVPDSAEPLSAGSDPWCFGDAVSAAVVSQDHGKGRIVTLATPDLFTNTAFGQPGEDEKVAGAADLPGNSVVAQLLLAPDGNNTIGVVTSGIAAADDSGGTGLLDLVPGRVKLGLAELLAAFAFYAWFRARRHGRLIREVAPVEMAASQLIAAVGNLRARHHDQTRVAAELRAQARLDLARDLGLAATATPLEIAAVLAERGLGTVDDLVAALSDDEIRSDAELMALTTTLDSVRREALHV